MRLLITCASMLVAPAAMAQETTTYTYDALGRLIVSSTSGGPNNGTTNQINHDPASNRTGYTITGASGSVQSSTKVIVVPLNGFTVIPIRNPWAAK
jgi:hypothetical protein